MLGQELDRAQVVNRINDGELEEVVAEVGGWKADLLVFLDGQGLGGLSDRVRRPPHVHDEQRLT